jgi:hypothetical protein
MKKNTRNVVNNPELEVLKNQMNKHGISTDKIEKRVKDTHSK